jgi:hypothetical protein
MTTIIVELIIFTGIMVAVGLTTARIAEKEITDDLEDFLEEKEENEK